MHKIIMNNHIMLDNNCQDRQKNYRLYCFTTHKDEERNAIVEFTSQKWQKLAIQYLDGKPYVHHVLRVEKSKPKDQR